MTDTRPVNWERQISSLVAADRLEEAARRLLEATPPHSSLFDDATGVLGELVHLGRQVRRASISFEIVSAARAKIAYRLLDLNRLSAGDRPMKSPPSDSLVEAKRKVFISYSHADIALARLLAAALEDAGLTAVVDYTTIRAGQDIGSFVKSSIRETSATICVLSQSSLSSGWVAQETMLALLAADLWGTRKFIACYEDGSFFENEFRVDATDRIDAQLSHLQDLKSEHAKRKIDTVDLDAEYTRLFDLRNQLGAVLHHVRNSLCLDLRDDHRDVSLSKLISALNHEDNARTP